MLRGSDGAKRMECVRPAALFMMGVRVKCGTSRGSVAAPLRCESAVYVREVL